MEHVKIIFDTDIGSDCDDAGALVLCHALCDLGEAELLAVTCCNYTPYVAGCIDSINRYCNKVVPIGVNYEKPIERIYPDVYKGYIGYDKPICEKFPNSYKNSKNVPDTLNILRKTLADADDNSITFVVTGALSSMARLIMSQPDNISSLTGKELVSKKIKRTVVMGGRFFETWPEDLGVTTEYNIRCDIEAAEIVCDEWCGELVFSSFEIGNECVTLKDFSDNSESNPAAYAYKIYPFAGKRGRESWDLTAVLYAVRPDKNYWKTSPKGKISVDRNGVTSIDIHTNKNHSYLIPDMSSDGIRDIIDGIVRNSKHW